MNFLLQNLRYAWRTLRKSPAYAAAAILTLAVGIGANTAIFSAFDAVVLKPLPYPEPDRLVLVLLYNRSLKYTTDLSYPDFLDWQRGARSFKEMAAFKPVGFDLTGPGSPEHVAGYEVSASFFRVLGVNFAAGHSFSSRDDRPGGMPAVVISHRLWSERFRRRADTIGAAVRLNGVGYIVTGVLPAGFRFEGQPADVYTPIGRSDPTFLQDRTVHNILCLARLKRTAGIGQAQAEMNGLQEHIDNLNPTTEKGLGTSVLSLKDELIGNTGSTLILLLGAVCLVLLIACANVANLLLARSAARTREFAVRRALGASRLQIIQQLITESLLLSLAGGTVGLVLGQWILSGVLAAVPESLPQTDKIGLDGSVLTLGLAVSIGVGVLFGLLPAFKYGNTDVQPELKEHGRGSTASHRHVQGVLAVIQIAVALFLLSGAGLLLRTVHNLWAVNPGFDTQHVIFFKAGLSPTRTATAAATRSAYQQLAQRIRAIPGIEAADLTALVPLGRGSNSGPFWIGSHQPGSMAQIPRAVYYPIGPDYPRTMRIPLLSGRYLRDTDTLHSELVALIDDVMAHQYFRDGDAVGRTITIPHWGTAGAVAARIVGVVGHVKQYGIDGSKGEQPQIYYCFYQLPDDGLPVFRDEVTFAARTRLAPAVVIPVIRNSVYGANERQPVYAVTTMRELVSGSMTRQRFPMILLTGFAGIALFLATVGIYGVMSYSTAQRVQEMGIRMALGAVSGNILQMLLAEGTRLAMTGVAIGLVAVFILARVVASFSRLLYGVQGDDLWTLTAVSAVLLATCLLACYVPARRAAQLDPMTALRQD